MSMRLPEPDRYRPVSGRKQIVIVLLAITTAASVLLSMLYRLGSPPPPPRTAAPDAARCTAGQTTGCVGGMATVIAPPAHAASASAGPGRAPVMPVGR